jgi:two-component system phosphate regulon sensor histidine kinase PhoR
MRRRIFQSFGLLAFVAVVLSSTLTTWIMYRQFDRDMRQRVRDEALYMAAAIDLSGDGYLSSVQNLSGSSRLTLIDRDGAVLFDTDEAPERMENHLARPEVSAALSDGIGYARRLSATLGTQTYYCAVRLQSGRVFRVAGTTDSVYAALGGCIPSMLLCAAAALVCALLLARWQTRLIVDPINALDLENPLSNEIYDELSPLLLRINRQKEQLSRQLEQLRQKQREFAAITENMNEGLVILSAKAAVLSINRSALRMFGAKQDDYAGRHILNVNRSLELLDAVDRVLAGEACERLISLDGRECQLLANPVTVDGKPSGAVLLLLDVTDRRAAEQLRREFSANVSHELKTPLTSISGYAELMKDGLARPEDIPAFARRIHDEAGRLIALIEDILLLSRLDEGNAPPLEPVALLALAREVCERLTPQADRRQITLSVTGEPVTIQGSRPVLEELVYNLCDNAVKYNRAGGRVDVNITPIGERVELTVADTGIGIPKAHQGRVFERFYRVDKSHSKQTGGTGLGLSIVKHAAQYHRAELVMESEPGKGTVIRVLFPA